MSIYISWQLLTFLKVVSIGTLLLLGAAGIWGIYLTYILFWKEK